MNEVHGIRLYLKIWAAVVIAVAVVIAAATWMTRQIGEPPLREVVVRNQSGDIVGRGQAILIPPDGLPEGKRTPSPGMENFPLGQFGPGPEFLVKFNDGEKLYVHIPRSVRTFWSPPNGLLWILCLVGIAVAISTYPIIRRLTRQLELLKEGVSNWQNGNFSIRVKEVGNDEIAFLAHQFNETANQLERMLLAHKNLLANASHDLRTPLTRLRMALELNADQPTQSLQAEIQRNLSELELLIDEILLSSRLDALQSDVGRLEAIDLTGLASEECARYGVEFDPGHPPRVYMIDGISFLMRRALRNLLENALRYGCNASEVSVQIRSAKNATEVCVYDRGPGVEPAHREQIFEPFFRLPGSRENQGGTGLGLALVQAIAKRHGGRCYCEERAGGGGCFRLYLPNQDL